MDVINLEQEWKIGQELGRGGFGRVLLAEAEDGSEAVAKLIPRTPGADRELLFGDLPHDVPNVIPVLDKGEWGEYLVLVMPRADVSLGQYLEDAGSLSLEESLVILLDVSEALAALEGRVVHRDLKPDNILRYEGHWVVADFGIARYTEASTATNTRKYAMTGAYAAPEQWTWERATAATDVYALGVIAFQLLQGRLPFPGPSVGDFREQHLKQAPPPVTGASPRLASLVSECLYKQAGARPTPANVCARLRAIQLPSSPGEARLHEIQRALVQKQQEKAAVASARKLAEESRREMLEVARASLERILDLLADRINEGAPIAKVSKNQRGMEVKLGQGLLRVDEVQAAPAGVLEARGYEAAFDVVAFTAIGAKQPRDKYQEYDGRAHSLWFCDAQEAGSFRWYELAFMVTPGIRQGFTMDPFPLPPTDEDAALSFAAVISVRQLDWPPEPFNQGQEEEFIERWIAWLVDVAEGKLTRPRSMPEKSGGSYRRARSRR